MIACGSKRDEHREAPLAGSARTTAIEGSGSRRSIDVTVEGAPISIRGVELAPTATLGVLELGYRVEARAAGAKPTVPGRIMCRLADYNVVYPASSEGKQPGPRLTSQFRPDPFAEAPRTCEVVFWVDDRRVAAACYQDGELSDGACPTGSFPPPPAPTGGPTDGIHLTRANLELRADAAVVTALYTLAEPLHASRRFAGKIKCEDSRGTASGEGALTFLPLDRIPVGASVFGPLALFLDRTPEPTASCELALVSRSTTGAAAEEIHAKYCLTTSAVQVGPCAAN